MILADGFVVGGRYVIEGLISTGSQTRVYAARAEEGGAGRVVVKVARHDGAETSADLIAGRERLAANWAVMTRLYEAASSAVPLPVELVRMYPGDPAIRAIAMGDRSTVSDEPYLVTEFVAGDPVSSLIASGRLDEERALLLALRCLLLLRAALGAGVEPIEVDPSGMVVDAAGENLTLVDVSAFRPIEGVDMLDASAVGGLRVPRGFGRLALGLLAGMNAPSWPSDAAHLERWERLLQSRRVPREYHDLLLGALGYRARFDATMDATENRLRALARATRPAVHPHPGRVRDVAWPLTVGSVIGDRFEVTGTLAQGGRGFIYRVRDERAQAEVLVKANKYVYDAGSDFALELPTRRLELEHEYGIMTRFASRTGMLPQPIAFVHDRGYGSWFELAPEAAEREPYLAMEWIKGVPLLDLLPQPFEGVGGAAIEGNRLRPAFVVRLVAQIADLLTVFHDEGYLLQDLKPENILYDPASENVYLVDLAGVCPRGADGNLLRDSVAFGTQTHGFAAPEFGERWERCDDRYDIYSLGATAYHLLTGVNPERVAIERGEEYPELPLHAMRGVASPVAALVARCLAPHEERFRSAGEVREAAERARLLLSRARPLDVVEPGVTYTEAGVHVSWTLPPDPRVERVRVTRLSADAPKVVYDGAPCESVDDARVVVEERAYRIETALVRRGEVLHSRGAAVRAEAHPPPTRFGASTDFGGNRIELVLPPHADGAVVRVAQDGPPATPDAGEAVPIDDGGGFHRCPPSIAQFYAAFARYGDELSAPRFASAASLTALPSAGALTATQSIDGVELQWERSLDGAVVEVHEQPGRAREIVCVRGLATVFDDAATPGGAVAYALRVRRGSVLSSVLATVALRRWPSVPMLEFREGLAGVEVVAVDADAAAAFERFEVVERGGDTLGSGADLPLRVSVANGRPVELVVRCEVGGEGPEVSAVVQVPPAAPQIGLSVTDAVLPVAVTCTLPPTSEQWTGRYVLRLLRDDQVVAEHVGPLRELARAGRVLFADASATPGSSPVWRLDVVSPSREVAASAAATAYVLERLPAPVIEPLLHAVRVEPAADVDTYDVALSRADGSETVHVGLSDGWEAELEGDEHVELRWRRSISGPAMPWSEPTAVQALERPPAPDAANVIVVEAGAALTWTSVEGPDVTYRVSAVGEGHRVVYEGRATTALDVAAEPAARYAICAVRRGLDSSPRVVEVSRATAMMRTQAVAHPVASSTRVVACVLVGTACAIELVGPAIGRRLAVLPGDVDGARRLGDAGPRWWQAPGLMGATITDRARVLLPALWRGSVRVWAADGVSGSGTWRPCGEATVAGAGELVGAVQTSADQLHLRSARGTFDAGGARLVAYDRAGVGRSFSLEGAEFADMAGGSGRALVVPVAGRLEGAVGVGLTSSQAQLVLVPVVSLDEAPHAWLHVWADSARGLSRHVLGSLAAQLGAPIVSVSVGEVTVAHLLVDGEHTEVRVAVTVSGRSGRARVSLSVRGLRVADEFGAVCALGDVGASWGDVAHGLVQRGVVCLTAGRSVA